MSTTAEMLAHQFDGTLLGNRHVIIHGAESLDRAGPHDIAFVAEQSRARELQGSAAGAVFVGKDISIGSDGVENAGPALIVVDDAQAAFVEILQEFRPQPKPKQLGISPDAVVAESAVIGEGTSVYPGATIDDKTIIGENCVIYPGVYIGPGCIIGDEVTLHANSVIYHGVTMGDRVIIHAGAVIGADGFGYRFEQGRYIKIPQLGGVRIENDVEIGAGAAIDRGMIGPTQIGEGSKIDNLVQIAHNCEIGKHNAFAAQVGFAGSASTGNYVRCGGQVGVADHVHMGDGSTVAAQSGVHKDVADGHTMFGSPARPELDQVKVLMTMTKLPEMRQQLRELQKQVRELTKQLDEKAGND
ncbi:MAG: UDP-3-O-(3-hydroxymyristoyl)glucosamine N-acyltransferase [Planctomycetaceae bacterium]|nr:UDP-3-O-(3-hydroxymyristoyl)glucosamine N-acyltransferase [Planctomycetaceae bacterium]